MKSVIVNMLVATSLLAAPALAVDMPAVGKAKCGMCHAVDKKVIGPSFKEVAGKYEGDQDAASKIAAAITKGGTFGWKMGSMPAKGAGANEAEVRSMAEFIAGLTK